LFAPVRDKDGISAAVVFADLAAEARASGRTVWDVLFKLYTQYGLWVSQPLSVVRPGSSGARQISAAMQRVRAAPPDKLGGLTVTTHTDYQRHDPGRAPWLGEAPLIELGLGEQGRVLIRPSGTEPKLKLYVDLRGPAPDDIVELEPAQAQLEQLGRQVAEALCQFALGED